jgi:hypothetical protein
MVDLIYDYTHGIGLFYIPCSFCYIHLLWSFFCFWYMNMGSIVWCKLLAMVNVWCFKDVSYVKMVDVLVFVMELLIAFDNGKLDGLC